MTYSIQVYHESKLLVSKPIESKEYLETLSRNLIKNDYKKIEKFGYYFPNVAAASRIENFALKIFATINAYFVDLIFMPICYHLRRQRLKNDLGIYKFLKDEKVYEKNLNIDNFKIQLTAAKDSIDHIVEGEDLKQVARKHYHIKVNSHLFSGIDLIEIIGEGTSGADGVWEKATYSKLNDPNFF